MTQQKPNVFIIMADQLRYDAIGTYTPNLNELKKESVVFNRAYCASPICVPARGAFFTGRYPNETGCLINPWAQQDRVSGMVKEGTPHLYQLMEKHWDSWHTGKQHLFYQVKPEQQSESLTHWDTEDNYTEYLREHDKQAPGGPKFKGLVPEMVSGQRTTVKSYSIPAMDRYTEGLDYFFDGYITNRSLEAITSRNKEKPLFLSAMYLAPHPPYHLPEPWYSMIGEEEIKLPDNVGVWYPDQSPLQMYNLTGVLGTRYSREEWRSIWAKYLGLVNLLDDGVGRVIDELKRQNLYDNSLIIFTSDHGEMLGSHRLWQKFCMYEESVRTPLWIKFPKTFDPAVREVNEAVSSMDVLPTLCEFLGLDKPEVLSGKSLMPLIHGGKQDREAIYVQYDGNGSLGNFQRCIVKGKYKLIVDLFKDETFLELYDVVNDPQETTNLAVSGDHAHEMSELVAMLKEHMERTGDHLALDIDLAKLNAN
ncbi:sulfatase-like hydrolase/transferase [Paenibacillus chondroitinus]|uniref:Sulfatase-like hydrolase/transferase n=1 Tax=Paenibacillus chondroitinus TaxID=59842 RepID=A0ABU6D5I5_9BACL|nr:MULTISPECIES: sulfatase-like hydrolase/transferase [Paenibacillus]MCY9660143.1 sulfatase-like hydrolase/transferase [Paenibacillus anseongense]MEB4792998.1 sulfatase-like hydrolase/transferase [Paenibacillus chondroitinus]